LPDNILLSKILLIMASIAETVRLRRVSQGLTQDQAAAAAGLSRRTLSDFEAGRERITLGNLNRLLRALGLELATREASGRPNLDELGDRYRGEEAAKRRRRARRKKTP
jgi:transcriptional regulator with XRE-family HTH domain